MKMKLKVFTVAMLVVAFVGALVYKPLSAAENINGEAGVECEHEGLKLIWWLLNNSEPIEVEGEAVTYHKDMLIVNTGDEQVRIALPEEWTVGTEIVLREMLFGNGYLSQGENVTINPLFFSNLKLEDREL